MICGKFVRQFNAKMEMFRRNCFLFLGHKKNCRGNIELRGNETFSVRGSVMHRLLDLRTSQKSRNTRFHQEIRRIQPHFSTDHDKMAIGYSTKNGFKGTTLLQSLQSVSTKNRHDRVELSLKFCLFTRK